MDKCKTPLQTETFKFACKDKIQILGMIILTFSVFANFMKLKSDHVMYYKNHHVIHATNSILQKICIIKQNM